MGYRYLSTSRGAGNKSSMNLEQGREQVQIPIYLDRGRKLIEYRLETCSTTTSIESYLPRQGPETHKRTCTHHQSNDLYSSQYTSARGRKLSVSFKLKSFHLVQLPINLARGRKQLIDELFLRLLAVQLPIYLERGRKLQTYYCTVRLTEKYRYLSTSRGAGNFPVSSNTSLAIIPMYRPLSTSGEAGNRNPLSYPLDQGKLYSSLSTSKGAGNSPSGSVVKVGFSVQIPIYLERGRKPKSPLGCQFQSVQKYRSLSTSRGDSFIRAKDSKSKRKKRS